MREGALSGTIKLHLNRSGDRQIDRAGVSKRLGESGISFDHCWAGLQRRTFAVALALSHTHMSNFANGGGYGVS